jgi:polyisoprenoid-binding protein YceI
MIKKNLLVGALLLTTACGFLLSASGRLLAIREADSFTSSSSSYAGSYAGLELAAYRIDPAQSQFMVHAFRGGLLYFKGHDHFIKVGDFGGEVRLTPDVINPASLNMTIRSDSLEETGADFTAEQKGIIKKELNEIVLESGKYPEITFNSTGVTGDLKGGAFAAKITGGITLHGVTKQITIPAEVSLSGGDLHAKGEFELNRKDFNVNATEAFHGTVKVKHNVKFTFDIVAHKV